MVLVEQSRPLHRHGAARPGAGPADVSQDPAVVRAAGVAARRVERLALAAGAFGATTADGLRRDPRRAERGRQRTLSLRGAAAPCALAARRLARRFGAALARLATRARH